MAHLPALRTACYYCGDTMVCEEWHPAQWGCICEACYEEVD